MECALGSCVLALHQHNNDGFRPARSLGLFSPSLSSISVFLVLCGRGFLSKVRAVW